MCGIVGLFQPEPSRGADETRHVLQSMTDTLRHRGPDDAGVWVDDRGVIALGHRRLSILDLSREGRQPMRSACGRYVVTYNGEIYNFAALRDELETLGHAFRGHSDTEVMLAAVSRWGLDQALSRFNGMFAFALWDRGTGRLHLVRDRLGEKPLYYGWCGRTFLFASELKALEAHPQFKNDINRNALALFMRHNCVPAPYSIYEGVFKLPPGMMLTLSERLQGSVPEPVPYWSAKEAAERGAADPFTGSEDEAVCRLEALLLEAVKLRMVADVPLGAFLSGGIDSSTVVALMQAQSDRPVKTFTIGFHEAQYDEAVYARKVAGHLGTDHTELYVTPRQALDVIPRLPTLYDEPFADSSQIPTFLVSELARQHVTVSLSGDGGDELFAGYNRYVWGRSLWRKIGWMPMGLRRGVAKGITALSPMSWGAVFDRFGPVLPAVQSPGDKLHKLAELLGVEDPDALYAGLASHWKQPTQVVIGAIEPPTLLTDRPRWARLDDCALRMMFLDLATYLPDDILVKLDRASMAVSLEARVPLLDHRVAEFAWRLPVAMKIRGGQGKWALRQVLKKYLPLELVDRHKMGFGVPIDSWLRGPLRDWAEDLLDERRLDKDGFFNPRPIREKWAEHLSGRRNWQHHLWDVLMFQAWLRNHGHA